jgi:transposase
MNAVAGPGLGPNGSVRPPNGTRANVGPHASRGGNAYPQEVRNRVIKRHLLVMPITTPEITQLRQSKDYPHESTCRKWIKQYEALGHVLPKRPTGNFHSKREVQGEMLVQLALFRCIRPKATIDEVRAYLHNRRPNVAPYSPSQINRAEKLLGLSRKAASTTADSAYLPINLQKRDIYWGSQHPYGMAGVDTRSVLDIDESGYEVEATNRKFGKTVRRLRCDDSGPFNRNKKLNLLLCIGGDDNDPVTFHETWTGSGTTLWRFYNYIERLLEHLAQHHVGKTYVFTMDNLNVHKNPVVEDLIESAGHSVIYRAPYWSVDGAIEYVFNTIHTKLQQKYQQISTFDGLENEINLIIGGFQSFKKYFVHVGFPTY